MNNIEKIFTDALNVLKVDLIDAGDDLLALGSGMLEKSKNKYEWLAQEFLNRRLTVRQFEREIKREVLVSKIDALTISGVAKARLQIAVNKAIDTLVNGVIKLI